MVAVAPDLKMSSLASVHEQMTMTIMMPTLDREATLFQPMLQSIPQDQTQVKKCWFLVVVRTSASYTIANASKYFQERIHVVRSS